jgi:hypothetical protein
MSAQIPGIIVVTTRDQKFEETPTDQLKRVFPNAVFMTMLSLARLERYLSKHTKETDRIYIDLDTVVLEDPTHYLYGLWQTNSSLRIHIMSDDVSVLTQTGLGPAHMVILPIPKETNLRY